MSGGFQFDDQIASNIPPERFGELMTAFQRFRLAVRAELTLRRRREKIDWYMLCATSGISFYFRVDGDLMERSQQSRLQRAVVHQSERSSDSTRSIGCATTTIGMSETNEAHIKNFVDQLLGC
jgi:hypothetical protein